MLDRAELILAILCFSGPLLYISLVMVTDPASFVKSVNALACAVRTLEHRIRGLQWQEPPWELDSAGVSPRARNAVRFAGLILAVCALLPFAIVVG